MTGVVRPPGAVGRWLRAGALLLAIGATGLQLPVLLADAGRAAELAGHWADRDGQYRTLLGDVPYDLLREADARLPSDGLVLLVTPGTNVRTREYTLFHRALYFLAPRPVAWITPAPSDGTWEARWWTTSSIDGAAVCRHASERGATAVLLLDLPAPDPPCGAGWAVDTLTDGTLVRAVPGTAGRGPPAEIGPAWPLQLLLAVAIPFALGAAVVAAGRRLGLRTSAAQRFALAWAIGGGLVSLAVPALATIGLGAAGRHVALGAAAGAVVLAMAVARARGRVRAGALRCPKVPAIVRDPVAIGLGVVIGIEVGLTAMLALGQPLSIWDGWAHWGMKARVLFDEGSITPATVEDVTRGSAHLHYPLGVPSLEWWLYDWLGAPDDRLVGVLGLLAFVALLAFAYGTLRYWGMERRLALAAAALLGASWPVWRLASSGYADVPFALLVAGSLVLLGAWLERGERGALVLGAAMAGLLGWVKMEGLAFAAVLAVALAAGAIWRRARGQSGSSRVAPEPARPYAAAAAAVVAGTVVLAGGWWAFVALNGIGAGSVEYDLRPAAVAANLDRIPTIVRMELGVLAWASWGLVWPGAAIAVVALAARREHPGPIWLVPAVAGLYLVALSAAYVATTYGPYTAQVEAAAYRIMLHAFPVTLLWLARLLVDRAPGATPPARAPAPG